MVLINWGQNGSYVMKGSRFKCLESTEGGATEHELAGCNFHKDKQCFLPPWIFCSLSEQKIGVNCRECLCQCLQMMMHLKWAVKETRKSLSRCLLKANVAVLHKSLSIGFVKIKSTFWGDSNAAFMLMEEVKFKRIAKTMIMIMIFLHSNSSACTQSSLNKSQYYLTCWACWPSPLCKKTSRAE